MRPRSPAPGGVNHTATSTMTNSTGWTSFGSFQPQTTDCSTMPSAIAANAMVGQSLHAADDRRRQRRQQQRRPEHGAEREPDDPGAEEHREEREQRRHHPHDRVHAAHGDAEQRGAVGVVGAGAHRDAEPGPQEQREPDERERDHDERDHVVAAEAQRVDR